MTIAQEQTQARNNFYQQLVTLFPNMKVYKGHCLITMPNGNVICLDIAAYPNTEEWEKRWIPNNGYLLDVMKGWDD